MQLALDQYSIAAAVINRSSGPFGKRIGLLGSVFGCWHKQLTRPFSSRRVSYRACLECGARKEFNTQELTTVGPFYYPPTDVSGTVSQ